MAEIFLRRTLSGFTPADADSEETTRGYKVNQVYRAKVVKPRSYQNHKRIMSLLSLTYKNLPEKYDGLWQSFEQFRKGIALSAGHVDVVKTPDGVIHETPGSLAYDSLDEIEFGRVAGAMMSVCAAILDMGEPELAAEVSRHADDSYSWRVA